MVGGKRGLRIAANKYVAAKATPSRKQLVGVLKFSGPIKRNLTVPHSLMFSILGVRSAKVSRKLMANGPPLECPDMGGCYRGKQTIYPL